jgi:isocitrate dehydrogenase (NAD+)
MMIKMDENKAIEKAKEHFEELVKEQLARVNRMKSQEEWIAYDSLKPIKIGFVGGDGIGPYIMNEAKRVLQYTLKDEITNHNVEIIDIEGLTIENRATAKKSIPDEIMDEIKSCNVILKGPTTTPREGDMWPNLESANIVMRRELDLFANIRPVRIPELGIDWVFFVRQYSACKNP